MPAGGSRLPGEPLTPGFSETLAGRRSSGYSSKPCCRLIQKVYLFVSVCNLSQEPLLLCLGSAFKSRFVYDQCKLLYPLANHSLYCRIGLVGIRGTNVGRGDGPPEYSSRQQEGPGDRLRSMGRMRERGGTWVGIVICLLAGNGNRAPPNDHVKDQVKILWDPNG